MVVHVHLADSASVGDDPTPQIGKEVDNDKSIKHPMFLNLLGEIY